MRVIVPPKDEQIEIANYLKESTTAIDQLIKNIEDAWKRDARMDGRGHSLSSYDGHENEETVEGTTFYIYRIN